MATLDAFVDRKKPLPESLATSQEIRDRSSTFTANIFRATTPAEAQKAVTHLRRVVHGSKPASHEIAAWRCMVLKPGKTGLSSDDDFEVQEGSDDDQESWAGSRVLKVMQAEAVIDAVVIVSRWYGGVMLGPIRFTHIETCAREVCRTFRLKDEVEDCLSTLNTLDDILTDLRAELSRLRALAAPVTAGLSNDSSTEGVQLPARTTMKKQDYSGLLKDLDVAKAKRLVTARENAIKSVKVSIAKAKTDTGL